MTRGVLYHGHASCLLQAMCTSHAAPAGQMCQSRQVFSLLYTVNGESGRHTLVREVRRLLSAGSLRVLNYRPFVCDVRML